MYIFQWMRINEFLILPLLINIYYNADKHFLMRSAWFQLEYWVLFVLAARYANIIIISLIRWHCWYFLKLSSAPRVLVQKIMSLLLCKMAFTEHSLLLMSVWCPPLLHIRECQRSWPSARLWTGISGHCYLIKKQCKQFHVFWSSW